MLYWIPDLFASQRATTNRNPVFLIVLQMKDGAPASARLAEALAKRAGMTKRK